MREHAALANEATFDIPQLTTQPAKKLPKMWQMHRDRQVEFWHHLRLLIPRPGSLINWKNAIKFSLNIIVILLKKYGNFIFFYLAIQ